MSAIISILCFYLDLQIEYLLLDEDFLNANTRNYEVAIGFGDMIPRHLDSGFGAVLEMLE